MPSLEDTPKLAPKTSPSGSDLIAILDVGEVGNSSVKKATLLQALTGVFGSLPGPYADDAAASAAGIPVGGLYKSDTFGIVVVVIRTV